jgi:hypothetical protein
MRGAHVVRRLVAEGIGTAFLLMAIVGSGIVVGDDPSAASALFIHAVIIGVTLTALILTFGPVSGAHFNPVVTTVDAIFGGLPRGLAAANNPSRHGRRCPRPSAGLGGGDRRTATSATAAAAHDGQQQRASGSPQSGTTHCPRTGG